MAKKEEQKNELLQFLGEYHLKDKKERAGVIIPFGKTKLDLTLLEAVHIVKVPSRNRIRIYVEWKSKPVEKSSIILPTTRDVIALNSKKPLDKSK